jgi:pSer/pThr/pTyr-binding forkhead associated (FHA) protein
MSYLQVGGQRHAIPVGDVAIGSDSSSHITLTGDGVAECHAIVQGLANGQVAIRAAGDDVEVRVNGVRLGANPHPLLHGDKVGIAGQELLFVDERRSGSTQYVQAMDPGVMAAAAKPAAQRVATAATGGRLVSLTDGREYQIAGSSIAIGRDASCEIVITSKNVSRRHAEVLTSPKGYLVVDSSTNGTIVNGKRIEGQYLLARGDVIQCGEHEFRFYADTAPEPAAAEPPAGPLAPPTPAPGADFRLANTLHGVPRVEMAKPEAAPPEPAEPQAAAPAADPAAESAALANLVVRSGPMKGQRFPIRVPVVNVGRAEYNDIAIAEESVSTTHAKLQRREGIWVLVDLESTNGTMVDGDRVEGEVPLAPGALIRFGDVQTIFEPVDDTVDAKKGSSTRVIEAIQETRGVSGPRDAMPGAAAPAAAPDRPTDGAPAVETPAAAKVVQRLSQERLSQPPPTPAPAKKEGGVPWWLFFVILLAIVAVAFVFLR